MSEGWETCEYKIFSAKVRDLPVTPLLRSESSLEMREAYGGTTEDDCGWEVAREARDLRDVAKDTDDIERVYNDSIFRWCM
jgi:hypothetical protein